MIEVSEQLFFSIVGPMDVTPYPFGKTSDDPHGMYSIWKNRYGHEIGRSYNKPSTKYIVNESHLPVKPEVVSRE